MASFEARGRCFVCSPENPYGIQARFVAEDGRCRAELALPKRYEGFVDTAHGGVVSALLDEAMFYALYSQGFWGATVELSVRFLKPTPCEEPIVVQGKVVGIRGRLGEAEAVVLRGEEELARAVGKFLSVGTPPTSL